MPHRRQFGLESLELKALSVPSSLRFLLGIEYDVVLCVTSVGSRRRFTLTFPSFAETFRQLLSLCARRFGLSYEHQADGSSVLSGVAVMPLLRYADYLPGALHMEELMDCLLCVDPPLQAKKKKSGSEENAFEASFLDYKEFASDASLNDVHGQGFYLTLDYGLNLASHGHLVEINLHDDWDPEEALREFQEFSGWQKFDLRFFSETCKRDGGIIVMPSIQDVCDLLEKYEDEDSDDEGDLLPFVLRPVLPLVSVPSVEDSSLRKQRDQHWTDIEAFWGRFERTRNTVVVYNLYEGATLREMLAFLETLPVVSSTMVEDASPTRRRRAFITLETSDAAKKALELDGRSTKGRTIRVQVAPPYIDESRRGRVLPNGGEEDTTVCNQMRKSTSPPGSKQQQQRKGASSAKASPAMGPVPTPAAAEKQQPAATSAPPAALDIVSEPTAEEKAAAATAMPSPGGHMNASAKEFVPQFMLNANSPEYCPAAEAPYADCGSEMLPPPPAYNESVVATPQLLYTPSGPAVISAPLSAKLMGLDGPIAPLPPYELPPPYLGAPVAPPSPFGGYSMHAGGAPPPPPPPPY